VFCRAFLFRSVFDRMNMLECFVATDERAIMTTMLSREIIKNERLGYLHLYT
jgi:hypothetical protein